jgi:hypothetical protein
MRDLHTYLRGDEGECAADTQSFFWHQQPLEGLLGYQRGASCLSGEGVQVFSSYLGIIPITQQSSIKHLLILIKPPSRKWFEKLTLSVLGTVKNIYVMSECMITLFDAGFSLLWLIF